MRGSLDSSGWPGLCAWPIAALPAGCRPLPPFAPCAVSPFSPHLPPTTPPQLALRTRYFTWINWTLLALSVGLWLPFLYGYSVVFQVKPMAGVADMTGGWRHRDAYVRSGSRGGKAAGFGCRRGGE